MCMQAWNPGANPRATAASDSRSPHHPPTCAALLLCTPGPCSPHAPTTLARRPRPGARGGATTPAPTRSWAWSPRPMMRRSRGHTGGWQSRCVLRPTGPQPSARSTLQLGTSLHPPCTILPPQHRQAEAGGCVAAACAGTSSAGGFAPAQRPRCAEPEFPHTPLPAPPLPPPSSTLI